MGLWSSGLTGRMGSESSCRLQGTLTLLRRCGAEVGKLAAAVQVGKHVGRLQVTMHLCWWRGVSSAAERREAWAALWHEELQAWTGWTPGRRARPKPAEKLGGAAGALPPLRAHVPP